jgi:preprotein translocase subunit YajC
MENLAFLALLACPLMMGGLFYFLMRGTQNKEKQQTEDLQKNMSKLLKQNEQLIEELDRLKNSR